MENFKELYKQASIDYSENITYLSSTLTKLRSITFNPLIKEQIAGREVYNFIFTIEDNMDIDLPKNLKYAVILQDPSIVRFFKDQDEEMILFSLNLMNISHEDFEEYFDQFVKYDIRIDTPAIRKGIKKFKLLR